MARTENASMAVQPIQHVQPRRGILQLGNNDASLAEQKILSQQISSLNAKLDKLQLSTTQNFQRNQNNAPGNNFQRRFQGGGLEYKSDQYLQPPPISQTPTSELEKALIQLTKTTEAFMNETRTHHKSQDASIRNLETQIGQLSRQLAERSPGAFPSDTIINPRKLCNAITTKSEDLEKVEAPTGKDEYTQEGKEEAKEQPPVVQKKQWDFSRFEKPLYPMGKALEKKPSYATFLKETLSKKQKLTEDEHVTLIEECSAIIQKNLPPKLKDPGSFSIPCTIGKTTIEKVLTNEALLPASQPKNQIKYIAEKKVEKGNKKEVHQRHEESKPKVKMEKPKSKEEHVKPKLKIS
ncbi:uncharacterized protein LOC133313012 [Gastrolobium bilobum]|uniref:uncharacterized protein LOC133313012 n=1 Tax=Gastrolobium bilobum TaxID=150636 RepID=UPI002AAFF8FA|nr:uncharacterized protein LOC133313012 [Gastrolobium bilobum]